MTTRALALEVGLVEVISVGRNEKTHCTQLFDYLLVLDFESTCWDRNDQNKGQPEIIEFPVVILDVKRNKIVEEFHQYVMPMENPKLSDFCIQFTGITQSQVDNSAPLATCLMVFKKWIQEKFRKHNMEVYGMGNDKGKRKCIFVTWSDWDLGTCLKNECKRKRIILSDIFKKWIDLRAFYKEHYNRRPNGLKGALTDVGLKFEGREHSGLHDARNTAVLAGQLIKDGTLLRVTKDILNI